MTWPSAVECTASKRELGEAEPSSADAQLHIPLSITSQLQCCRLPVSRVEIDFVSRQLSTFAHSDGHSSSLIYTASFPVTFVLTRGAEKTPNNPTFAPLVTCHTNKSSSQFCPLEQRPREDQKASAESADQLDQARQYKRAKLNIPTTLPPIPPSLQLKIDHQANQNN